MRYALIVLVLILFSIAPAEAALSITDTLLDFKDKYAVEPFSIVYGAEQNYYDFLAAAIIAAEMAKKINNFNSFPKITSDTGIASGNYGENLIIIGGPCSNRLSEHFLKDEGITCENWKLPSGTSFIKAIEKDNRTAIIIFGSTETDTLRAARSIRNFEHSSKLSQTNEAVYYSHMSITEAIEYMIEKYAVNDDLVIVPSNEGQTSDFPAALRLAEIIYSHTAKSTDRFPNIKTPDKVKSVFSNLILIGGPCANKLTESIITEEGFNCYDWRFKENEAVIKLFEYDGKVILLIAGTGTDPAQTMELVEIIGNYFSYPELEDASLVVVSNHEIVKVDEKEAVIGDDCKGPFCKIRQAFGGEVASQILMDDRDINYVRFLKNQDPNKNCYSCFMESQSKDYVYQIMNVLSSNQYANDFSEGEKRYVLGKITENKELTCTAIGHYLRYLNSGLSLEDQLIVYENILFLSTECLSDREQYYYLSKVLTLCDRLGHTWKSNIYSQIFHTEDIKFNVNKVKIKRSLQVPKNATKIEIGKSYFIIDNQDRVAVQVERVTRDWLSLNIELFPNQDPDFVNNGINYMEGEVVRRIVKASSPKLIPIPNTLIVSKNTMLGRKWYATDEQGVFRFEVLPDKVQYPTTKCIKNVCLLVDTHGISSLVAKAIYTNSTVVIGCGDYYDKMDAAYYLAMKGINVLYPCDRFASEMVGYKAPGVALGSAPVKNVGKDTVVGNQSIMIGINEKIVVQTTTLPYPAQYYDAPYRYFKSLSDISRLNLDLEIVDVSNLGETYKVVDRAREIGAEVIAVRVAHPEDYEAVKDWLLESPRHRATLHHSACYTEGLKILEEFPDQTTFADPHPVFY